MLDDVEAASGFGLATTDGTTWKVIPLDRPASDPVVSDDLHQVLFVGAGSSYLLRTLTSSPVTGASRRH